MLAALMARFHRHNWLTSAWNPYMMEVEQRCRCGARRHAFFKDFRVFGQPPEWRDGPHPVAERMRAETHPARQ